MKSIFVLLLSFCNFWGYYSYGQVNVQTGESIYSIPIFEHIDPKSGLGSSVGLDYRSMGGVKVSEYASIVGQGWNLNAGGVITRIQHGEPDDQFQTESFSINNGEQIFETNNSYAFNNYYPNGYLFSPFSLTEIAKEKALVPRFREGTETSNKYKNSPRALDDKEQDVFYFNYGNMSGTFVIGKNGDVEILDNSKIKIIPSYFTTSEMLGGASGILRTKIKSFTIIDCNGIEYVFSELEWSKAVDIEQVSTDNTGSIPLTVSKTVTPTFSRNIITKWFLSKIKNPLTDDIINFRYTVKYTNYLGSILPSYSLFSGPNTFIESISVLESWVSGATKILEAIDYPDDFHVQFNYGTRTDIATIPRLNDIQILYSNKIIHTATLDHKYFFKNLQPGIYETNEQEKYNTRLCLQTVTIDNLKYEFEYYTGNTNDDRNIVPPVHSFSQDGWGFYNGSELYDRDILNYRADKINQYIHEEHPFEPSSGLAKNGLLKAIILPTKGKISFEYEQNSILENGIDKEVGGVRVVKVIKQDPVGQNPDVITRYSYRLENGQSSGWGGEPYIHHQGGGFYYAHDDNFNWGGISGQGLVAQQPAITGIVKITFDLTGAIGIIEAGNPLPALYLEVMKRVVFTLVNILDPNTTYYHAINSYSPFSHGTPVSLCYSRVEEKIISQGIHNGKIVQEFTYPNVIAPNLWPFSSKQRLDNWKYNLPSAVTVYNDINKIIKKTTYSYLEQSTILDDNFKSCKVESQDRYSSRYDWPLNNLNQIDESWFTQEFYNTKKGNSLIKEKMTVDFGSNGSDNQLKIQEFYDYDGSSKNLPREVYSFNSKGDRIGQTIYYSGDYEISTGAMQELKNRNIINVPITILKWYIPYNTSDRFYTDIITTEYTITTVGTIKPYRVYKAFNQEPIPYTSIGTFDPSNIFIQYPGTTKIVENVYDDAGNLVLTVDDAKRRTGYVYDFNGRYATATVSNAAETDFAFSGFESESGGNWTITNCIYEENIYYAPTGKKYLKIGNDGTINKQNLNKDITYVITYWSHSNPLSINGNYEQIAPLITINGWSLYSHKIQGVEQIELRGFYLSETVDIDELRFFPTNARMSTVAYDPVYGKISETDVNNRTTYYRYDAVGRLEMILDHKKNVIKTFDYNTINKKD